MDEQQMFCAFSNTIYKKAQQGLYIENSLYTLRGKNQDRQISVFAFEGQ
jgi:hypothetical protein